MTELVHSIALIGEILIAGLIMYWGFRLMKEGWILQKEVV